MASGRLFSCRAVPVGSQRRDVAKYPCSCGSVGGIYISIDLSMYIFELTAIR